LAVNVARVVLKRNTFISFGTDQTEREHLKSFINVFLSVIAEVSLDYLN